jgi:dCTP deaminase
MILTGLEIAREVKAGRITIDPFDERHLNPNSYNFALGPLLKVYREHELNPARPNLVDEILIPPEGMVLDPARLYLGHIVERIGSNHYVPIMRGRSGIGRLGLFINITSDLIDQGAYGQWTLQLHAVQPLRVHAGMRLGQMTFWVPRGKPLLYNGKYQNAVGPGESLAHLDFDLS